MNRRNFLYTLGKSAVVASAIPYFLPSHSHPDKSFLMGKGKISSFTNIGMDLLEKETASQFKLMQSAARKEGIEIELISGFRSFSRQKEIFEKKFKQLKKTGVNQLEAIRQITQYSSIPGTSRHHWGTDLDMVQNINSLSTFQNILQPIHFEEGGAFYEFHLWMKENASDYGFYLTYTKDEQRTGYKYEPWHYSYLPKAKPYLHQYLEFEMAKAIQSENIQGLKNMELDFFEKYIIDYVLGINSVLK